MTQPLYPPASPQSIGEALDSAFRIFQATLVKCLPHGVLAMIASQLASIYQLAAGKPMSRFGGGDPLWWVLYVVGALAGLLLWSAMMLRQHRLATHRSPHLREEGVEALRRLPVLVGAALLGTAVLVLGLIALVIPGLYLMTALIPMWPLVLLERCGPWSALHRSLNLIRGHWWHASAVLTVAFIVAFVFYLAFFALIAMMLPLAGANDVALFTASSVIVLIALGAVAVPFYGAVVLALFGDLKTRRTGSDLEQRIEAVSTGP